jgi:hypothetical protein
MVAAARRARGCATVGDDRIKTRLYAVKRYLFRLGHAASSARYATSIEQLVVGLAPVMGWGTPPRAGAGRARFVRAHRQSVQRWLDDLQAAGLVAHEPERDEYGRWWRTQIVLLLAPEPSAHDRRSAERRVRGWRSRARRRRRRGALPRRSLESMRRRTAAPDRRTRARLARCRRRSEHERRRRADVEQTIAAARAQREGFDASLRSASYVGGLGVLALAWFSDEWLVSEGDLIGLTRDEVLALAHRRDRQWLRDDPRSPGDQQPFFGS